jgi:CspA family cold shock protein
MTKGTVKWFNDAKGYGFIQMEGSDQDIFVHHTSIQAEGFRTLNQGEEVQFDLTSGPKGPKAENVMRMDQAQ